MVSGRSPTTLPLKSADGGATSTGTDSPVRRDASTHDSPSVTTPSTGTSSPGRSASTSPIPTCSAAMSSVFPFTMRCATCGRASSSSSMARDARLAAYFSSSSPPLCMTTITRPAIGSRSSTAVTMDSVATTSVAKWPRTTPRSVRQTIGAPVMISAPSPTCAQLTRSPFQRQQCLPASVRDAQEHVPTFVVAEHLDRRHTADAARVVSASVELEHDLHLRRARIVRRADEGGVLLGYLRAELRIDDLESSEPTAIAA